MEKKNFVKTNDAETAEMLRKAGFVELAREGDKWVFLNENGKMDFSDSKAKVCFDNKLTF